MTEEQNIAAQEALRLMQDALALLDKAAIIIDAAAHLDLAIHRLTSTLGGT